MKSKKKKLGGMGENSSTVLCNKFSQVINNDFSVTLYREQQKSLYRFQPFLISVVLKGARLAVFECRSLPVCL